MKTTTGQGEHTTGLATSGSQSAAAQSMADLLERLIELHEALHAVIADKLEAMRRSDVPAMLAASAQEGAMVDAILALDQRRAAAADELAGQLGLPAASRVNIAALAARMPDGAAAQLRRAADVLREKMLAVARGNRVVELVCQQMLGHLKAAFADLVQSDAAGATYSPGGSVDRPSGPQVINAVG